jgi:hypothetical protein
MVAEDVPIYLAFLDTPRGRFLEGYSKFEQGLSNINYQDRRQRLAETSLYARFCEKE